MVIKYQAPSVKKAFQILTLISRSNGGLGISELAKSLGISKSTVHGITSALEEVGAVRRDPDTKKYTCGLTLFELGRSTYAQIDLKELARPVMENLMENTQESVFLGVLNGGHVTILDIVESRQDLKITSPIGTTMPLLAGAVGKAFLSIMDEDQALKIIKAKGLPRYTENTIIDPELYLEEIRRVRNNGYATDDEEYIPGVRAVVCPVVTVRDLLPAIWVVGFKTSLDDHKMKALIGATKEAAEAIGLKIERQPII